MLTTLLQIYDENDQPSDRSCRRHCDDKTDDYE